MTLPFPEELISAYLDGELAPDQRAFVEQQLRDHADARKVFDDLRALRQTLQSLPVIEPDDGFAQRVMRAAERRMLTAPMAAAPSADQTADLPISPIPQASRSHWRNWRIAAGIFVTAGSLLVMAVWFSRPVIWNVAQAPAPQRAASARSELATDMPADAVADAESSVESVLLGDAAHPPDALSRDFWALGRSSLDEPAVDAPPAPSLAQPTDSSPGGRALADSSRRVAREREQAEPTPAAGMGGMEGMGGAGMGGIGAAAGEMAAAGTQPESRGLGGGAAPHGMGGMPGMPPSAARDSRPGNGVTDGGVRGALSFERGRDDPKVAGRPMLTPPGKGERADTDSDLQLGIGMAGLEDEKQPALSPEGRFMPEAVRPLMEQLAAQRTIVVRLRWDEPLSPAAPAKPDEADRATDERLKAAPARVAGTGDIRDNLASTEPRLLMRRLSAMEDTDGQPTQPVAVVEGSEADIRDLLARVQERVPVTIVDAQTQAQLLRVFGPSSSSASGDSPALRTLVEPATPLLTTVGAVLRLIGVEPGDPESLLRMAESAQAQPSTRTRGAAAVERPEYVILRISEPAAEPVEPTGPAPPEGAPKSESPESG